MKKKRASPERVTFAHVLFASPGVEPAAFPQSTPGGEQSRVEPPGSHLRPMSSASPVYSPAPSAPSSVGALAAAGIVVFGTMPSVRSSKPLLAPNVVVIRTVTFVFCWLAGDPGLLIGSVEFVNELETSKLTVVSPPAASGPYGFVNASAVSPAGSVSVTVPLWLVSDQLWTSTGSVNVDPAAVV